MSYEMNLFAANYSEYWSAPKQKSFLSFGANDLGLSFKRLEIL